MQIRYGGQCMRKLELIPYKKDWAENFKEESKKIQEVFNEELLAVHHIGSTAIPRMLAKPIIDILVEVQNIKSVDSFNFKMNELGYISKGENGIVGRRFFVKYKNNNRTHHVHIYQSGECEISKHLMFRDYLIENSYEAERYNKLKASLYKDAAITVDVYQEKKSPLVNELTESAINWANKNKKISVKGFIIREKDNQFYELLTLSLLSNTENYLQVPGGGVEENESLITALNREIQEETGLSDLNLIRKIGTMTYYKPFIKRVIERHDFLLDAPSDTENSWVHRVTGEDKDQGKYFKYNWVQSLDFPLIAGELRSFLTPEYVPELFNNIKIY